MPEPTPQVIAEQWRRKNSANTGYVIIKDQAVLGWINRLRDPEHWAPGCLAVDDIGNTWTATGRDPIYGARRWTPTTPPTTTEPSQ